MPEAKKPPTFRDATDREWLVEIDFATLRRIKCAAQVDLGNIDALATEWASLLYDDEKALAAVWQTIHPAADARSLSFDDFLAGMNGDALEKALEALGEAVTSFTQPRKRGLAERAIRGVSERMREAMNTAEENLETLLSESAQKAHGT